SKLLFLILLGLVINRLLKNFKLSYINNFFIRVMLWLGIVAFVSGVARGNLLFLGEFINDFRFFLNFFLGFFLVILFLKTNEKYEEILPILSTIFIVKTISILIFSIFLSKSVILY